MALDRNTTYDSSEEIGLCFSDLNLTKFLDYIQGNESEYSLLLGDVDQIHTYVFETSKLPEIRGASQLLDALIRNDFNEIFNNCSTDADSGEIDKNKDRGYILYNNAGSCMAIVPTGRVEEFTRSVKEKFLRETGAVTITFAHSPFWGPSEGDHPALQDHSVSGGEVSKWLLESNTGIPNQQMRLLRFLQYQLSIEKKKKSSFPFLESNPIVRRCSHCGKRPAVHEWKYENETYFICSVCNRKRLKGDKSEILTELVKRKKSYADYMEKTPPDLDNLVGNSGYIGILYVDGNEMGKMLYGAQDLKEFKARSQEIESSILESLDSVLERFKNHRGEYLPFEILNRAGDDILMILQSEYVLEFSLDLLSEFEATCSKKLKKDITVSLGATIFRAKYPVQYAFELAKSLLKSAKRFSKQTAHEPCSAISYLYMKTPIAATSCEEILHSYYTAFNEVYLTMRPYTRDEFGLLLSLAREISQILTNSQVTSISRSFEEKSPNSAMNFVKYQIARMGDPEREPLLRMIEKLRAKFNLKDLDGTEELPLWGKRIINGREAIATPFLDIFEISEIMGGDLLE
ncbi:MAG: hypothetical protein WBA22_15255 [Candidatus Methanofastidiosia archaeon]